MILRSITLHNIRSHADTSIKFGDGIILFRGDMGTGKSTILMAVEFALFGTGSLRGDSLVSKGRGRGEVVLAFESGGREYEVHRTIAMRNGRATQTDTRLVEDGVAEPLSPTELKVRVLGILGFREPPNPRAVSRVYRYAVYTPQEEIKAILSGDGREETIRRAFGMDDYKTAADNAKSAAARMRAEMADLAPRFERLEEFEDGIGRAESEAGRLGRELGLVKSEIAGARAAAAESEADVERLDRELVRAEGAGNEMRRLESELGTNGSEMSDIMDSIRSAESKLEAANAAVKDAGPRPTAVSRGALEEMIADVRDRDGRHRSAESLLGEIRTQAAGLAGECGGRGARELEDDVAARRRSVADAGLRIDAAADRQRGCRDRLAALDQTVASLGESLAKAESLGPECEWCGTRLDADHGKTLAAERRGRLERAKESAAKTKREAGEMRDAEARLRADLAAEQGGLADAERMAAAAAKLALLNGRIAELRGELDSFVGPEVDAGAPRLDGETDTAYLGRVMSELAAWNEASSQAALAEKDAAILSAKIAEMGSRYNTCRERACMLEGEIAGLRGRAAEAERLRAEAAEARSVLTKRRAAVDSLIVAETEAAERRERAVAEAERLRGEADMARAHKGRHAELGDCSEWLRSPFLPALRSIEEQVMASTLYEFREHYREWYGILVDDHTKRSDIGGGFEPTVEQDGVVQDMANLSGGERTSVALAYRLSLNAMVRRQTGILDDNLLVLDEPTDGFSREQMSKVLDILARLDARQVIVVSHEPEMEGYADTVYRVAKSDGRSSVTRVGQ